MDNMEAFIYGEMVEKLHEFQTLTGSGKTQKANPKATALKVELTKVQEEIENLLDTLTGANAVLLSYANTRIAELDGRKQLLVKEIADLAAGEVSFEQLDEISGYLDNWESTSFDDRRRVVGGLITVIRATSEKVQIQWKI